MTDDAHPVLLDVLLRRPDHVECETLSHWLPIWDAAGALSLAGDVIEQAEQLWSQQGSTASTRWVRDRPILKLGREVQRQRAVSAWDRLGWTNAPA